MLRMRLADNMGNAGDEQIMRMLTMQHIVVSVPAGTGIYLVFTKSQATDPVQHDAAVSHVENTSMPTATQ
jgi:hypothetical protein